MRKTDVRQWRVPDRKRSAGRVRFGLFELDPATGELRREGALLRLQPQPAAVLAFLVEHAGEVVTREALREAVWGGDTFVDFDRGLNFCIAQIRAALGDIADSPRFIRTLTKRGYQFIAPVDGGEARGTAPPTSASPSAGEPRVLHRRMTAAMIVV